MPLLGPCPNKYPPPNSPHPQKKTSRKNSCQQNKGICKKTDKKRRQVPEKKSTSEGPKRSGSDIAQGGPLLLGSYTFCSLIAGGFWNGYQRRVRQWPDEQLPGSSIATTATCSWSNEKAWGGKIIMRRNKILICENTLCLMVRDGYRPGFTTWYQTLWRGRVGSRINLIRRVWKWHELEDPLECCPWFLGCQRCFVEPLPDHLRGAVSHAHLTACGFDVTNQGFWWVLNVGKVWVRVWMPPLSRCKLILHFPALCRRNPIEMLAAYQRSPAASRKDSKGRFRSANTVSRACRCWCRRQGGWQNR